MNAHAPLTKSDETLELADTLRQTHWIVMTHFGPYGIGGADPKPNFTDACSEYADNLSNGYPAQVWQLDFAAGTMANVTDQADAKILGWHGVAA
jgi:hypothetical protein